MNETSPFFHSKPFNPAGASSLEYVLQVRDGGEWPQDLGRFARVCDSGVFSYREDLQQATRFPTAGAAAEAIARRDHEIRSWVSLRPGERDIRCSIVPVRVTTIPEVTEVVEIEPAKTVVDFVGGEHQPISGFVIRDRDGDYMAYREADGSFGYTTAVARAEIFSSAPAAARALNRRYASNCGKMNAPHVIVPVFITNVPAMIASSVSPAQTTVTLA